MAEHSDREFDMELSLVNLDDAGEKVGRHTQINPAYAVHRANSSSVASTLWVPATVCSCPTA